MPDFDGHEAPTSLGSIYGYRYWYLMDRRLVSVSTRIDGKQIPWKDGENIAVCTTGPSTRALNLPPRPNPPEKPDVLTMGGQDHASRFFGDYVNRARVSEKGDFSFPTLKDGSVMIPHYTETEEFKKRLKLAEEHYAAEYALFAKNEEAWLKMREEAQAKHAENHRVPVLGCSCGFYMVKEPQHAKRYAESRKDVPLAFGVVEGYGKVVVGEKGWRFEKARIVGLVMTWQKIRDALDLRLGEDGRVHLMQKTIDEWNDFDEYYGSTEKYDSSEELRAEWDERVENS